MSKRKIDIKKLEEKQEKGLGKKRKEMEGNEWFQEIIKRQELKRELEKKREEEKEKNEYKPPRRSHFKVIDCYNSSITFQPFVVEIFDEN
jgi:hypothetical protein